MSEVKLLGKKENNSLNGVIPQENTSREGHRMLPKGKKNSSSSPGFESVGQILKYYRELKGLSLEEVSKRTYIKLKYLSSLEENLQDLMPAPVYVYSYIKHYAKLLGLEGGELVKLYQKQCNINDSGLPFDRSEDEVNSSGVNTVKNKPENIDNIYLQNKNIIELNSKDINKDNGKTLMDLDSILDTNNASNPVQAEKPKPVYSAVKQEATVSRIKQESGQLTPKASEAGRPEERIIHQEIINATAEADRIISEAKKEAERIIKDAQEEAYDLRHGAQSYADNVLKSLEQELFVSLTEIKNGRDFLRSKNL